MKWEKSNMTIVIKLKHSKFKFKDVPKTAVDDLIHNLSSNEVINFGNNLVFLISDFVWLKIH